MATGPEHVPLVGFPRLSITIAEIRVFDWQEERLRRGDDLRLQMALEESRREKPKEEVCVEYISVTFKLRARCRVSFISNSYCTSN